MFKDGDRAVNIRAKKPEHLHICWWVLSSCRGSRMSYTVFWLSYCFWWQLEMAASPPNQHNYTFFHTDLLRTMTSLCIPPFPLLFMPRSCVTWQLWLEPRGFLPLSHPKGMGLCLGERASDELLQHRNIPPDTPPHTAWPSLSSPRSPDWISCVWRNPPFTLPQLRWLTDIGMPLIWAISTHVLCRRRKLFPTKCETSGSVLF